MIYGRELTNEEMEYGHWKKIPVFGEEHIHCTQSRTRYLFSIPCLSDRSLRNLLTVSMAIIFSAGYENIEDIEDEKQDLESRVFMIC